MITLACIAVCLFVAYDIYYHESEKRKPNRQQELIDMFLPLLEQYLNPPEPPKTSGELIGGGEFKFQSHFLRIELDVLTQSILKAHSYQIDYAAARAKAENIVEAEYAVKDAPLSARMMALVPGEDTVVASTNPPEVAPLH